jgi:hypothetical protein
MVQVVKLSRRGWALSWRLHDRRLERDCVINGGCDCAIDGLIRDCAIDGGCDCVIDGLNCAIDGSNRDCAIDGSNGDCAINGSNGDCTINGSVGLVGLINGLGLEWTMAIDGSVGSIND